VLLFRTHSIATFLFGIENAASSLDHRPPSPFLRRLLSHLSIISYCYRQFTIINPKKRRAKNENYSSGKTMAGVSQVEFTKKIRLSRMRRSSPGLTRILEKGALKASPQTKSLNFWMRLRKGRNNKPNASNMPTSQPSSTSSESMSIQISAIPATTRC